MFINPKTDFAFKKIFGSRHNHDILISFLNGILYQGKATIVSLVILKPYQAPRIKGIENPFLDIEVTLCSGQTVIIEMQVLNTVEFERRVLYSAANAYSMQLKVDEDCTLLNPIIALTITDFEMFPNNPDVISYFMLREKEEFTTYNDDVKLVFVELPKFTKTVDELETLSDKWIYFLRFANTLKVVPASMGSEAAIGRAFKMIQQSKLTRRQVEIVEQRQRVLHDYRNMILYAEQQGERKRKLEVKLEIARRLLDILDVETIALKTGLSLAEIEDVRSRFD